MVQERRRHAPGRHGRAGVIAGLKRLLQVVMPVESYTDLYSYWVM